MKRMLNGASPLAFAFVLFLLAGCGEPSTQALPHVGLKLTLPAFWSAEEVQAPEDSTRWIGQVSRSGEVVMRVVNQEQTDSYITSPNQLKTIAKNTGSDIMSEETFDRGFGMVMLSPQGKKIPLYVIVTEQGSWFAEAQTYYTNQDLDEVKQIIKSAEPLK